MQDPIAVAPPTPSAVSSTISIMYSPTDIINEFVVDIISHRPNKINLCTIIVLQNKTFDTKSKVLFEFLIKLFCEQFSVILYFCGNVNESFILTNVIVRRVVGVKKE